MRLYLDYAASAPLRPEVREAMEPWFSREFGNASSLHAEGRAAKAALDLAREQITDVLGCAFGEFVFTSGGTEAANLALVGAALAHQHGSRRRILMSAVEHHCVLETAPLLEALGFTVELIQVDRDGRVRTEALTEQMADDVLLVSVMYANNELGTWQPVEEVAAVAKEWGALFHCDATQALGLPGPAGTPWTVQTLGADLVSVSAHKVGGPKGVGGLYVRAGTPLKPIVVGGGQERELRAGTENVANVVGFGKAVSLPSSGAGRALAKATFRNHLRVGVETVSPTTPAHPGIFHIRIPGADAEAVLIRLDRAGVSASSGAACSAGSLDPSHVLLACGYSAQEAREGLRFSFGDATTPEQAQLAAGHVTGAVEAVLNARNG